MDNHYKVMQSILLAANVIFFIFLLLFNAEDFICSNNQILPINLLNLLDTKENISTKQNNQALNQPEKLLNITNFQYLLNNKSACPIKDSDWKILVIIVHTARENFVSRNSIRTTWGSVNAYQNWKIKTIFLLGMGNSDNGSDDLFLESLNYGDVIEGNFIDSYRNMTYKHMMGYKWTLQYCPQSDYIFRVDDDTFVDLFTIIDILNNNKETDLICTILSERQVERNTSSKWYVTESEYSPPFYPPYCLGAGYLLSFRWVQRMYLSANKVNFFWVDDIFITGIVRKHAQEEFQEKMTLLSFQLFEHVLLDVNPDKVVQNFKNLNSTTEANFPAIYCTILRKDTFHSSMEYLWNHVSRFAKIL